MSREDKTIKNKPTSPNGNSDPIRQERELLAAILDGNPIPTFVIDKNHKVILWNRACENLTQVPREKVLGRLADSKIFYPDQDRPLLTDLVLEMDQISMKKFYGDKGLTANTSIPEAFEGSDLSVGGRGSPAPVFFSRPTSGLRGEDYRSHGNHAGYFRTGTSGKAIFSGPKNGSGRDFGRGNRS